MTVIKRDGTNVDFDRSKIVIALQTANDAVEENSRSGTIIPRKNIIPRQRQKIITIIL